MSRRPPTRARAWREREHRERRTDIVRAAVEVFSRYGYAGATVEEIAARADVSRGSLYLYFPEGKEDLLRAALDELFDGLDAVAEPLREAPTASLADVWAGLHGFVARSARLFTDDAALLALLAREVAWRVQGAAAEPSVLDDRIEGVLAPLAEFIEGAAASGAVRAVPSRPTARMMAMGVSAYLAADLEGHGDPALGGAAVLLTTLLVGGLAPIADASAVAGAQDG